MERDILQHIRFAIGIHERDILEKEIASRRALRLVPSIKQWFTLLLDHFHQARIRDHAC